MKAIVERRIDKLIIIITLAVSVILFADFFKLSSSQLK